MEKMDKKVKELLKIYNEVDEVGKEKMVSVVGVFGYSRRKT